MKLNKKYRSHSNAIIVLILLLLNFGVFAQNHIKHKVSKGETITQISLRYKVTPYDIYKLNPDAQNGLQENAVLLIPLSEKIIQNGYLKHEVVEGDTLFKIANLYQLNIEELLKNNTGLSPENLQIGQVVLIPVSSDKTITGQSLIENNKEVKFHIIESKETKYSISKKYDISIAQLERWNPEIKDTFPIGYKLIVSPIPFKAFKNETEYQPSTQKTELYRVAPKETLFSISRRFDVSIEELLALNPELENGLKLGMELKVPIVTKSALKSTPLVGKPIKNLADDLNLKREKEIVILLPFNLSKIKSDTVISTQQRLKKDNFLNLTLDVYAGVLMALDSAKRMNYPLKVTILDSKENRYGSSVNNIINSNQLSDADAVIGPFYPQNITTVAKALEEKNVPVISPLRDVNSFEKNIFESMPSQEDMKSKMIDFLKSKNGNLLAFIDPKKGSSKKFLSEQYPSIYQIPHVEKVGFVFDSLAPRLSKTKTNYFLLESATTSVILNALRQINQAKSHGHVVSLVLLEMNPTYETDEVFRRIISHKPLFPSLTNARDTHQNTGFAESYKKRYNAFPNQYVMRGFDVTFDVIQRLLHEDGFQATIEQFSTEQLDYKFEYHPKARGGYSNKGIYLLYYDEDFTVKNLEE